jgi:hypothetical protein
VSAKALLVREDILPIVSRSGENGVKVEVQYVGCSQASRQFVSRPSGLTAEEPVVLSEPTLRRDGV